MLRSSDLAHFRDRGFVAVNDFFTSREMATMQIDVGRLKRVGRLRNVATEGDTSTRTIYRRSRPSA